MVVVVVRRIRSLPRGSVARPQCRMYLFTATSLDKVNRVGHNAIGEKRLHVLPHGLDTPGECHDEGVFDSSCDWSGQRCEGCVLQRLREQEMYDPWCMPLDQRRNRLTRKTLRHLSKCRGGTVPRVFCPSHRIQFHRW